MSEVANTASGIGGFLQRLYKPIILWVQDVFATKATAVAGVAYDATNKKLTKTINGTTSDVVAVSTLKSDMNLAKADVGLGNVENKSAATLKTEIMTSENVKSALGTGSGTTKFLREDGTWQTPPDTDTRGVFNNDTLEL